MVISFSEDRLNDIAACFTDIVDDVQRAVSTYFNTVAEVPAARNCLTVQVNGFSGGELVQGFLRKFDDWVDSEVSFSNRAYAMGEQAEANAKEFEQKLRDEAEMLFSSLADVALCQGNETISVAQDAHKLLLNELSSIESDGKHKILSLADENSVANYLFTPVNILISLMRGYFKESIKLYDGVEDVLVQGELQLFRSVDLYVNKLRKHKQEAIERCVNKHRTSADIFADQQADFQL